MANTSLMAERASILPDFTPLTHLDGATTIRLADPADRLAIWSEDTARDDVAKTIGLALPDALNQGKVTGDGLVLRSGPEEYLAIKTPANGGWASLEKHDFADAMVSLTDVSHRNMAFVIDGPNAAWILTAGCAQDLRDRSFPVSKATRTVFAKAEVILWRETETRWRVEVWRSFAPYLAEYFAAAIKDPV